MVKSKFVIDGRIEGKPESLYLARKEAGAYRKFRTWIGVLSVFSLLMVFACFGFFFRMMETEHKYEDLTNQGETQGGLSLNKSRLIHTRDSLQKELIRLQMINDKLTESGVADTGVFFEVQIGNYSNFNLDNYDSELTELHQYKNGKNVQICLGRFRSFEKATLFENEVRKIGITGAFIVGRIDGKLVNYQDALKASQAR